MKIAIDIDCTPEEARAFLGLPDVKHLQEAMVKEMQEYVKAAGNQDLESLMKTWMAGGLQNLDQFQKAFWDQARDGETGR